MRRKQHSFIADEFWKAAGGRGAFPCQLETAVLWALPLAVIKLPRLSIFDVESWLAKKGIQFQFGIRNRSLHGSLLAYRGHGCVLLNGADGDSELRYSLAHETAHFLLNYLRPRRRAESILGSSILEVFDGFRAPTVQERVHGILGGAPIGFHIHYLDRGMNSKVDSTTTMEFEENADLLAVEIIAPEEVVRRRVAGFPNSECHSESVDIALQLLTDEFGLPHGVAEGYASYLYPPVRSSSIREWLRQQR